jgi:hypothetical protein
MLVMEDGSIEQGHLIGWQCLTAFDCGGKVTSAKMAFNSGGGGW